VLRELEQGALDRVRNAHTQTPRASLQQLRKQVNANFTLNAFAGMLERQNSTDEHTHVVRDVAALVDDAVAELARRAKLSPTPGSMYSNIDGDNIGENCRESTRSWQPRDEHVEALLAHAGDSDGERLVQQHQPRVVHVPADALDPFQCALDDYIGEYAEHGLSTTTTPGRADATASIRVAQQLSRHNASHNGTHDELPVLTPALSAQFLREADPLNLERPCACDDACLGRRLQAISAVHPHAQDIAQQAAVAVSGGGGGGEGFTLREFIPPGQDDETTTTTNADAEVRRMCLLCDRHNTQTVYAAMTMGHMNLMPQQRERLSLQTHTYRVGPGGYSQDAMLPMTTKSDGSGFCGLRSWFIRSSALTYRYGHTVSPRDDRVQLRCLIEQPQCFF
jgi:hypothetical protein